MGKMPGEPGDKPPTKGVKESMKKGSGFRSSQQWNGHHAFKKPITQQPKCEGKGFIYDFSDSRQANIFAKMTKEITKCVGPTYMYGSDA
jgi:hypothetical protein